MRVNSTTDSYNVAEVKAGGCGMAGQLPTDIVPHGTAPSGGRPNVGAKTGEGHPPVKAAPTAPFPPRLLVGRGGPWW